MGLANDMDELGDTDSSECPCCGGPRNEDCSVACNGCYIRFEIAWYKPDMEDVPGEVVFHDWGARPMTAEQVEVGQAWMFEPAPGERSVWLVESIEQTAIGPQVFLKRRSPRGGIEMDCYARSMVEDKEAGWTFLRHAYDAEQFAPAPEDEEEEEEEATKEDGDEWVEVVPPPRRDDASVVAVGQHWRINPGMEVGNGIGGGAVVEVTSKGDWSLLLQEVATGKEDSCGPYIGMIAKLVERRPAALARPASEWVDVVPQPRGSDVHFAKARTALAFCDVL